MAGPMTATQSMNPRNASPIITGQSTPDGRIFLKCEEECLAACTGAPMMMVDHIFHENLSPAKVDEVLDKLK